MGILPSIITHLRNVLSLLKKNSDKLFSSEISSGTKLSRRHKVAAVYDSALGLRLGTMTRERPGSTQSYPGIKTFVFLLTSKQAASKGGLGLCTTVFSEQQERELVYHICNKLYSLLLEHCICISYTFASDLVDLMGNHLQPKPSDIAERYKFRHRVQENQESIANFVAVLKRQRLFTESKLTYTKAVEIAMCMESAEINAELVMKGDGAMNKISTFRKRISDSTALVNQGRQPPAVFSNSKLEPSRRSRKCRIKVVNRQPYFQIRNWNLQEEAGSAAN
ncbi:hypothetical protein QE152_g40728 [Popillia japonica]|uniref:Uncharacterized protein n=1 Tax=Popillia japonica TaxID=7064 RepID=A0AAW1HFF6_POPJA